MKTLRQEILQFLRNNQGKEYKIENSSFSPFFNGDNLKFFKENVFLDKADVFDNKPELKDIYANQIINKQQFGRLTILNNESMYANVNEKKLGILGKDSIYDVIYSEIKSVTNWRKVRKNIEPCKNCIYECLCPPVSNYEFVIGKNNLCNIWNSNK